MGRVKLSVCGKETGAGEIIATSANQILPSNSRGTKCCTIFTRPFFPFWKVEGRAGSKTSMPKKHMGCVFEKACRILQCSKYNMPKKATTFLHPIRIAKKFLVC